MRVRISQHYHIQNRCQFFNSMLSVVLCPVSGLRNIWNVRGWHLRFGIRWFLGRGNGFQLFRSIHLMTGQVVLVDPFHSFPYFAIPVPFWIVTRPTSLPCYISVYWKAMSEYLTDKTSIFGKFGVGVACRRPLSAFSKLCGRTPGGNSRPGQQRRSHEGHVGGSRSRHLHR